MLPRLIRAAVMAAIERQALTPVQLLHATAAALHGFAAAIADCDTFGVPRARIQPTVETVRQLHARSPFVRRLQTWPRGYAGDFMTIEMIYNDEAAGDGRLGRYIDRWSLQMAVGRAVKNRRGLLNKAIRDVVRRGDRARGDAVARRLARHRAEGRASHLALWRRRKDEGARCREAPPGHALTGRSSRAIRCRMGKV